LPDIKLLEGLKNADGALHSMLSLKSKKASGSSESTIYVVEGAKGNDGSFNSLLELMDGGGLKFYKTRKTGPMQGTKGLIAKDDVVLIKVNCQWDECGMTNTDLVKAITAAVLAHPDGFKGEVVIADNGQDQYGSTGHGGFFDYRVNNAEDRGQSVKVVVDSMSGLGKVSCYLWDAITEKRVKEYSSSDDADGFVITGKPDPLTGLLVSYPKFKTVHGTRISFKKGIWDLEKKRYDKAHLKIINTPVLKAHFIFGVTGAVKHYMGVNSDKLTAAKGHQTHPTVGKGGMGTLMAETRVPTLNILDAIRVNAKPGTGPKTPFELVSQIGIVAASLDPVALDYWASKNIMCPLAKAKHKADTAMFDPDNKTKGSFGDWLKLSCAELNDAGYPFTYDEKRIAVRLGGKA
jgi:uncharacterized protein (DUF362 family)